MLHPQPTRRDRQLWNGRLPPVLIPLLRAYVLGYGSAVAPRLITLILQYVTTKRGSNRGRDGVTHPREPFFVSFQTILQEGLDVRRFPTFCAALVGGTTLLELPLRKAFSRLLAQLSGTAQTRLSRWLATFVAAWFSLRLLQSKESDRFTETVTNKSDYKPHTIKYAGRTLDLTLFAAARAVDVIVGELWAQRREHRVARGQWTRLDSTISSLTDSAMFAVSSGLIMWAWFYHPSQLPRGYNKWISSAARVDGRLITALQRCRNGQLQYGKDTGQAPLLQSMCQEYKWPLEWGDPLTAIPFPCEMVHMGCGPSCEYHAFNRFYRSFQWAMATYLPLSLLLVVRSPSLPKLKRAFASATRSSAFLGAFITLFYYGVCLSRTRVGPHIIGKHTAAREKIDSGLCVATGCALCGWSILIEDPGRRKDMALFVVPRALATLLPRRYSLDKQWRENLVFAASTAVVFTCVLENKKRVRGVLGRILGSVLDP